MGLRASWRSTSAAGGSADLETCDDEVLVTIARPPPILFTAVHRSSPPVQASGRRYRLRNLRSVMGRVSACEHPAEADLPFGDRSFDLVVARYRLVTPWPEIARANNRVAPLLSH